MAPQHADLDTYASEVYLYSATDPLTRLGVVAMCSSKHGNWKCCCALIGAVG